MVESTTFHIKDQASRRIDIDEDKYLMSIDLLKNNCIALKEGLEMFECSDSCLKRLLKEEIRYWL